MQLNLCLTSAECCNAGLNCCSCSSTAIRPPRAPKTSTACSPPRASKTNTAYSCRSYRSNAMLELQKTAGLVLGYNTGLSCFVFNASLNCLLVKLEHSCCFSISAWHMFDCLTVCQARSSSCSTCTHATCQSWKHCLKG